MLADATVAPALQAAQAELEKARLEDKLEGRLERRPDREDLERRGIVSLLLLFPPPPRGGPRIPLAPLSFFRL